MQILNNPGKVPFKKPLHYGNYIGQRPASRASSINISKPSNNRPYSGHQHEKTILIPKKVSFHYTSNTQQQKGPNITTQVQQNIKIQQEYRQSKNRKISQYSKNDSKTDGPSFRYRIHSTDQCSNTPKGSDEQKVRFVDIDSNKIGVNDLNYPPKIIKRQTKKQKNTDFQRQRSPSSISSKSSTKLIVETVRKINPDGTKSDPIEIKHRVETEYLTNLNDKHRHNHHFVNTREPPKHIIVNHNYHSPNNIRSSHSHQSYSIANGIGQSQFLKSNLFIGQLNTAHQSNQTTNEKAKFSEVFSYPIKNSGEHQFTKNIFQIQRNGKDGQKHSHFKGLPVTSQSKFEQNSEKEFYTKIQKIRQFQPQFQNPFSDKKIINNKQMIYRGYGADITNEVVIQNLVQRPHYKDRKNKNYLITSEFCTVSSKLIDQIFRNQTEKALLKLNTIDCKSPRRYRSPRTKTYKHQRSTQKKSICIKQNRAIEPNLKYPQSYQHINITSSETLHV